MKIIKTLKAAAKVSLVDVSNDELMLICPAGIGDTYFVCGLSQAIAEKYQAKVSLIIKPQHQAIADAFSKYVHRIVVMESELIKHTKIGSLRLKKGKCFYAHPSQIFFPREIRFIGYKINLLDSYKILFRLGQNARLVSPQFKKIAKKGTWPKNITRKNKVAFICPESQSVDSLPSRFWQTLFITLENKGYQVVINSIKPEFGYKNANLFAQLEDIPALVNESAVFISGRSGICDLVATTRTPKVIIYKDQTWYDGTVFEASSLVDMNIGQNFHEILFTTEKETLSTILKEL